MKAWLNLDHQIYQNLKKHHLLDEKFRICVSGGADSIAVLTSLGVLLDPQQIEIFHFHHGEFENAEFRNLAQKFVKELCLEKNYQFISRKSEVILKNEKEMRQARLQVLSELHEKSPAVLVWGHHLEDLLETRLLRLMRGTGAQGFKAIAEWKRPNFRPVLGVSRLELRKYLQQRKAEFVEDPSNQDKKYLRNWLRNSWLPELEKRQKGSLQRMAQSFEHISRTLDLQNSSSDALGLTAEGLDRRVYLTLSEADRARVLAMLFFSNNIKDFRSSQIGEIQKRLDNCKKELKFRIAGVEFNVNAERIWIDEL